MAKLRFSVDSALLSELGEKLVESVHVAMLELVKNAYDADATQVFIRMIPTGDTFEIQVRDNGTGMMRQEVQDYWMRIATTHKLDDHISEFYGRKKSGSKGIGRFSCRRLGAKLELSTTAELDNGEFETTTLSIDWDDYVRGSNIDEIECEGSTRRSKTGEAGTSLIINGGKPDEWTHRGWKVLKRRLMLLVSNRGHRRRGFEPDPGFNVSLEAPGFEETDSVDQREVLMDAGWGRLSLKVNRRGQATWELDAKRIGHKELQLPDRYPDLAGTKADIAILPGHKSHFRDPTAVGIVDLRPVLEDWGGVHVRVDGIRVFPFAEGRNDWLYINRDRGIRSGNSNFSPVNALAARLRGVNPSRYMLSMLSFHSYVGEVDVSSGSGLFNMKASREGFVGERGLDLLREVVRSGIDWSTAYRDFYLRSEKRVEAEKAKQQFERVLATSVSGQKVIEDAVDYVQKEVSQIATRLPANERRKIVGDITRATKAVLTTNRIRQDELQHLRLIASTSSLLLIFSHEVKSLLGNLDEYADELEVLSKKLDGKSAVKAKQMANRFSDTKDRFVGLLDLTSVLSVESRESKPAVLALKPRANRAVASFRLIKELYDIDIDLDEVPNSTKVGPMLEAELYAILLNVLSNSIKSVIARGGEKRVAITAKSTPKVVRINILDNGLGVPSD